MFLISHICNNSSFSIYKIANEIDSDTPEYQKKLIYTKTIEIRENYTNKIIEQPM